MQYLSSKIAASETRVQSILESLRHKRKLIHDKLSRKKKRKNSDQTLNQILMKQLSLPMKREDDKAKNVFKE